MKQTRRILLSAILMLLTTLTAMAQNIQVKGTVIDKTYGEPVIGATVQEVGTKNATITDFDGNFTISVAKNAQLQFSYVGMKTITLPATSKMDITMEDDSNLMEELVVTGYTTQRKADLSGAVSVVDTKALKAINENNPMKALQGRVPGMNISTDGNPSGAADVKIRGIGTLNSGSAPLYIIDGVPTTGGMHELNGNDIESIQVLKDAASASIYGSRAANGVIIITTKKGKEGKIKVDFDATVSASYYVNRTKTLNARQWGQAFWQANVNDGKDPNKNNVGYSFDWAYDAQGNPVLNSVSLKEFIDDAGTVRAGDTDWFDEVTRTGIVQNYNLAISNGSEKGNSYFSLGYFNNKGTIKTSDFERISGRSNSEYKLLDGMLTIGENLNINYSNALDVPGNTLANALQFNPHFPIYNEKGEYAQPLGVFAEKENPLSLLQNNSDNRYYMWRTFGDVHLNINPMKGLNLRTTFGLDYSQKKQKFYTYPIPNGKVYREDTAVEYKQEHWMKWMWNAIATYNFETGKHRGDAMIGMELNRNTYEWSSAKHYGYDVLNTDYMWPSAGSGKQFAEGLSDGFSLVSFFGKVNYTYADKYMASLTMRRDGSSRFGKDNQYGTFPSASAAWRISQEKFMENLGWLDDLKIRYSWGMTGNSEINNTARYTLYQKQVSTGLWGSGAAGSGYDIVGNNGNGNDILNGYIRTQRGNDDIKWETTIQHNIGLDFALFGNELYGSFEWFDKNTKDILLFMDGIAAMGEGAGQWINAGEMKNTGIELAIGYRHKYSDAFSWDINGNIATYKNEITALPETVAAKGSFGGNGIKSVIGHAMGSQCGYIYDGIFKSQSEIDNHAYQEGAGIGRMRYKDINGVDADGKLTGKPDGKITEADRDWIFDPTPAFTWGLNIYLQYKNWDLTMFWQGEAGKDVITMDTKCQTDFWVTKKDAFAAQLPNQNKGDRVLGAWTPANYGSNIPALTLVDNNHESEMSSYYVENGSYAKLRTLQLGYNVPDNIAKKLHLERLRAYASVQNLLTIKSSKFSGVDPENPSGFAYPIPMNVTFGVNVSF